MGKSDREVRAGGHEGRAGRGRRNAHHRRKRKLVHRAGGHGKAVQRRAGGRCKRCTGVLGGIELADGASGGDDDRTGRQRFRREAWLRQAHLRQQAIFLQQRRLRRSGIRLHRCGRTVQGWRYDLYEHHRADKCLMERAEGADSVPGKSVRRYRVDHAGKPRSQQRYEAVRHRSGQDDGESPLHPR